VRRAIADRWHCYPWDVDEASVTEVQTEIRLMQLEGEAEAARSKRRGKRG
jgi:hypothetical protein